MKISLYRRILCPFENHRGFPKSKIGAKGNFCAFGENQKAWNETYFDLKNHVLTINLKDLDLNLNPLKFLGYSTI